MKEKKKHISVMYILKIWTPSDISGQGSNLIGKAMGSLSDIICKELNFELSDQIPKIRENYKKIKKIEDDKLKELEALEEKTKK